MSSKSNLSIVSPRDEHGAFLPVNVDADLSVFDDQSPFLSSTSSSAVTDKDDDEEMHENKNSQSVNFDKTRKRSYIVAASDNNLDHDNSRVDINNDTTLLSKVRTKEINKECHTGETIARAMSYDNTTPKSGKWTIEEEKYAQQLIYDFELGLLTDCEEGATLRSYLSRYLNCAPMRISKKFAGKAIGKVNLHQNQICF
jgi:hypothetical protein